MQTGVDDRGNSRLKKWWPQITLADIPMGSSG
jgi:hypothetical protein